jgi:hypothetical protein
MSVFRPPVFNLLMNTFQGGVPYPGAPFQTNVPCQLYVHSRFDIDLPGNLALPIPNPAIMVRYRIEDYSELVDEFECPAGSGLLYVPEWVHPVHLGFTNQYMLAMCQMWTTFPAPGVAQFYGLNVAGAAGDACPRAIHIPLGATISGIIPASGNSWYRISGMTGLHYTITVTVLVGGILVINCDHGPCSAVVNEIILNNVGVFGAVCGGPDLLINPNGTPGDTFSFSVVSP